MGKPKEGIPYLKKAAQLGNSQAEKAIKILQQRIDQADRDQNENLELDFVFQSSDHLRYENNKHVAGPHGGAPRSIKVEANISGNIVYTVTLFDISGAHATIQMAPKQMKLIEATDERVTLKGYGADNSGVSFADYGLTILRNNGSVQKCILHMIDRKVDIEYLP